jgi:hypothetical protein
MFKPEESQQTHDRINKEFGEKLAQAASALDTQVGGNHYKDMAIQPIEFTHKNGLNFCQGNIIKYATRYKAKNGVEDLKKVKHYAELLAKLEYGADI